MQITVNDFYTVAKVAHENRLIISDDVFKEINKTMTTLSREEFDTILKRKTINNFIKLTFGNDYYDSNFVKYLDEKLASTDVNSDVVVSVNREQLDAMKSAFEMEFNDTSDKERKEKIVKYARDVSTTEIDKVDTIDFNESVINTLKELPLKYMNKELEDIIVKYNPSRFKLK